MRITVETEAADELVLDTTGADKDRVEAIRRIDTYALFNALKNEVEFRIRLEQDSGTAAENREPGTRNQEPRTRHQLGGTMTQEQKDRLDRAHTKLLEARDIIEEVADEIDERDDETIADLHDLADAIDGNSAELYGFFWEEEP